MCCAVLAGCGDGPTGVRAGDLTIWSDSGALWVKNRGPETIYYTVFMADFIFSITWQPCTEVEPTSRCPRLEPGATIRIPHDQILLHQLADEPKAAAFYWWRVFQRNGIAETMDLRYVIFPLS